MGTHFTPEDEQLLRESGRSLSFARGELLIREGQNLPGVRLIRSGTVRVVRQHLGKEVSIATLGAGESFGEISFLDQSGASASVVADEDVVVDFLSNSDLAKLFTASPALAARFFRAIALTLAERLRETSAMVPLLLCRRGGHDTQD